MPLFRRGNALRRAATAASKVGAIAVACACGEAEADTPFPDLAPAVTPGYPETASRLSVSLGDGEQKLCHATLVHPRWVLTAAHCFSLAAPDARGALKEFERAVDTSAVEFYPGAHASGAERRLDVWYNDEFVAAHDLALVPVDPPMEDVAPARTWAASAACKLEPARGVQTELPRRTEDDVAATSGATLVGAVDAATLLGPGHSGTLLSAVGAAIGPGDSGSGVTAAWEDLEEHAPGCDLADCDMAGCDVDTPGPRERVLVGVVQNANPAQPDARFGLVPLHDPAHASWLASTLATPPPPRRTPMIRPSGAASPAE